MEAVNGDICTGNETRSLFNILIVLKPSLLAEGMVTADNGLSKHLKADVAIAVI